MTRWLTITLLQKIINISNLECRTCFYNFKNKIKYQYSVRYYKDCEGRGGVYNFKNKIKYQYSVRYYKDCEGRGGANRL